MEPLPPLPPLPALPPLPPLPPLELPAPLPEPPPLKVTAWAPLSVNPVHCGNYDLGSCVHDTDIAELPFRQLWDGREWADKLPANATHWRGIDKGYWVHIRAADPPHSGWFRMRYPKGEKSAPSLYVAKEGDAVDGITLAPGWYYAHPKTGEILRYAMHPRFQAEWWHDGGSEL